MSDERQRADGGAASGVDSGGEALTDSSPTGPAGSEPIPDPWLVRYAVYAYLIVMPVGHLVVVPVNGAMATLTDVFLGLVVLAGSINSPACFLSMWLVEGGEGRSFPRTGRFTWRRCSFWRSVCG